MASEVAWARVLRAERRTWEAMAAVALAGAAAEQNRGLVVERRPQGAPGTM